MVKIVRENISFNRDEDLRDTLGVKKYLEDFYTPNEMYDMANKASEQSLEASDGRGNQQVFSESVHIEDAQGIWFDVLFTITYEADHEGEYTEHKIEIEDSNPEVRSIETLDLGMVIDSEKLEEYIEWADDWLKEYLSDQRDYHERQWGYNYR